MAVFLERAHSRRARSSCRDLGEFCMVLLTGARYETSSFVEFPLQEESVYEACQYLKVVATRPAEVPAGAFSALPSRDVRTFLLPLQQSRLG
ncbi:hypothetical protein AV530_013702 [Patagioenas fasciata monilis]|uniref:Uncharacterized protein n=1 Tax=Patagioenas fasciata monilis TaxID=372326 RepID=A0A1V4J7H1_PATFA|nr:hypothetical protein AV530_013702 [Patagioenas fasciata monilis]